MGAWTFSAGSVLKVYENNERMPLLRCRLPCVQSAKIKIVVSLGLWFVTTRSMWYETCHFSHSKFTVAVFRSHKKWNFIIMGTCLTLYGLVYGSALFFHCGYREEAEAFWFGALIPQHFLVVWTALHKLDKLQLILIVGEIQGHYSLLLSFTSRPLPFSVLLLPSFTCSKDPLAFQSRFWESMRGWEVVGKLLSLLLLLTVAVLLPGEVNWVPHYGLFETN